MSAKDCSLKFDDSFDIFEGQEQENNTNKKERKLDLSGLFNQNYKNFFQMNSSSISESSLSSQKSLSKIDEDYLNKNEQINEVKFIFFMILYNACSYDNEYISVKNQNDNKLRLRRLIVQNLSFNDDTKELTLGEKNYLFIPKDNKGTFAFIYENKNISLMVQKADKKTIMKINGKDIMNEEEFNEKYEYITKKEKEQKKQKEQKKNVYYTIDSDDELLNPIKFYHIKSQNEFIRYIFLKHYENQMDGLFTKHRDINLNITGKVEITKALIDMKNGKYNIDNDLQSHIIFKNFDSNIIQKDIPLCIEVKKGFNFLDLLIQIKEDAKIMRCLDIRNKINFPEYIIGIISSYNISDIEGQLKKLENSYKNENISTLEHIIGIINRMKINVVIGAIKNEKIKDYPLGSCDYDIPDLKLSKRIDLQFLNKKVCEGQYTEKEIEEIINKYQNQYKSIVFEKLIPLSYLYQIMEESQNRIAELTRQINELKTKNNS